jgi:hypothetical protein
MDAKDKTRTFDAGEKKKGAHHIAADVFFIIIKEI